MEKLSIKLFFSYKLYCFKLWPCSKFYNRLFGKVCILLFRPNNVTKKIVFNLIMLIRILMWQALYWNIYNRSAPLSCELATIWYLLALNLARLVFLNKSLLTRMVLFVLWDSTFGRLFAQTQSDFVLIKA